jgi:hypothetical protein
MEANGFFGIIYVGVLALTKMVVVRSFEGEEPAGLCSAEA